MKNKANEKLLADMMEDGTRSFREDLYSESLKELQRRKRNSKQWLNFPLAIAAGIVFMAGLLLFGLSRHRRAEPEVAQAPIMKVAPALLPGIEVVTSTFPTMATVESRHYQSLIVDNSSVRQPVEILADRELFALFPDRAAGLIENSSGAVQLVFLDSRERVVPE
jgi:hypothetical protein